MAQNNNAMVDDLWEAAARSFPVLLPEEQQAGIGLHRQLSKGEPLSIGKVAQAFGISTDAAETFVRESKLSPFIHTDKVQHIVGFDGLTVAPTHHQLMVNGRTLWAWCAVDSLFIPELLGEPAEVVSRDPETNQLIRLTVSSAGVESVGSSGIAVSLMRPNAWELTSAHRIMASACHFIFFFASRASGERWLAKHPETVLLSLNEAFLFGKRHNAHLYGTELARRQVAAE